MELNHLPATPDTLADEFVFELRVCTLDIQSVVLVLKACLNATIRDNLPLNDFNYQEYDPRLERQVIAESLISMNTERYCVWRI